MKRPPRWGLDILRLALAPGWPVALYLLIFKWLALLS